MILDTITDQVGREHKIFESAEIYNENNCGNSFQDFELLSLLGSGSFSSVIKVRSKINRKIYAMKIVDLTTLEGDALRLSKNEVKFLQGLHNRHVINYYTHFEENGILYIINEYMNNGDISNYIEAQKKTGIIIKEEILWNIFLQSMIGLSYIHSKGIIHRDIKPSSLMMDKNMIIKIGDFNVSALLNKDLYENQNKKNKKQKYILKKNEEMLCNGTICGTPPYMAKEILSTDFDEEDAMYDQKIDVYSMGCTFFELCYFHTYKKKDPNYDDGFHFIKNIKDEDKNIIYSNELLKIIYLMLEEDAKKRPTSNEILELIQKIYITKYVRNTSIESVIRCLSTFQSLTNSFLGMDVKNKPVCYKYKNCLMSINNQNIYWNECINDFRQLLSNENYIFERGKEIEPRIILAFLLERIHRELNNVQNPQVNKNCHFIITNIKKSFNSLISHNLLGICKTQNICQTCYLNTFNFNNFCFITFDLEKTQLNSGQTFFIQQGLLNQNSTPQSIDLFCKKCLNIKKHQVFKKYFFMPNCLIISFKRGAKCQIKTKIEVLNFLYLYNIVEHSNSPKRYRLVGIISKTGYYGNENYSSYINRNGQWEDFTGKNNQMTNLNNDKGVIIILFYEAY